MFYFVLSLFIHIFFLVEPIEILINLTCFYFYSKFSQYRAEYNRFFYRSLEVQGYQVISIYEFKTLYPFYFAQYNRKVFEKDCRLY